MKLSKVFLVLGLIVGLVFMAGSVKAADSMMDNVPGNGSFAYFYASPNCISTVISIFNTDDTAHWVHIIAKDQDSKHVWSANLCISHKGTAVLHVYATGTGAYINGIGGYAEGAINDEILFMSPNADGNYMGYLTIVAVKDDIDTTATACKGKADIGIPVDDDVLLVTTALVQDNWWVGVNAAMVQGLEDAGVDDLTGDILPSMLAGRSCVNLYGRWYNDANTRGDLVLVFPVGKDNNACFVGSCPTTTPYPIVGYSYDEHEHKRDFGRCIKEANMIPFGEVLPDVGAGAGWVEIDNTTASAFGFTIMENGIQCDALPLFKESVEVEGQTPPVCPTCTLP